MKYLIRVVKYFIYIVVILALILWILSLLKVVEGDIGKMFRNGYDSLWQLGLAFLAVAAIYPKFGYTRRGVVIPGAYSEIRPGIVEYMENRGYRLESEENENLSFRLVSPIGRLTRTWEDRITMTRDLPGFYLEGRTKDVVRIASGLEYKFREND